MTLIRRSLYQDLVKLRANLLNELEARTEKVKKIENEIADKEGFVANFDKTQDDLTASITSLENTIREGENEIPANKTCRLGMRFLQKSYDAQN